MKRRAALYSASRTPLPARAAPQPAPPAGKRPRRSWRRLALYGFTTALIALIAGVWLAQPQPLTAKDVQAVVKQALESAPPPPSPAQAYERIIPSVVAVRASPDDGEEAAQAADTGLGEWQRGTGVIIVESGLILTNLHVVQGAKRIHLTFMDGTESEATIVGERPEHDLAVLQAKTLPDDITPATMRSTAGLRPGDEVVAVGFPFGIGPSTSAGVISGLKRDYISADGERLLSNLIQFDAAVNPGNSGGPLVTLDGEVVGIVTGLLNPTQNRVFIGIGFAVPIENAASAIGLSPF
jgi:S1-C subfamily serine protease